MYDTQHGMFFPTVAAEAIHIPKVHTTLINNSKFVFATNIFNSDTTLHLFFIVTMFLYHSKVDTSYSIYIKQFVRFSHLLNM